MHKNARELIKKMAYDAQEGHSVFRAAWRGGKDAWKEQKRHNSAALDAGWAAEDEETAKNPHDEKASTQAFNKAYDAHWAAQKKTASLASQVAPHVLANLAGAALGYNRGKAQVDRGEDYAFGIPQVLGAVFLPGGIGYQGARAHAHEKARKKEPEKEPEKETQKESSWTPLDTAKVAGALQYLGEQGCSVKEASEYLGLSEAVIQGIIATVR